MICEYFNKITAGKIWNLWQGSTCSDNTPSVAALRGYPGVHGKRLRNDKSLETASLSLVQRTHSTESKVLGLVPSENTQHLITPGWLTHNWRRT